MTTLERGTYIHFVKGSKVGYGKVKRADKEHPLADVLKAQEEA